MRHNQILRLSWNFPGCTYMLYILSELRQFIFPLSPPSYDGSVNYTQIKHLLCTRERSAQTQICYHVNCAKPWRIWLSISMHLFSQIFQHKTSIATNVSNGTRNLKISLQSWQWDVPKTAFAKFITSIIFKKKYSAFTPFCSI